MTTATRIVELAGGMRATLVHHPQATRAAALVKVGAGSHHETDALPGLAHLLEHLLFRGSQRYHDDERLMAWIQRQGGSVNATTLARHSAYFFEVAANSLAEGITRLRDTLRAPLLSPEDIRQELAVIDAENRLIQQHDPSRREAAARHAMAAPAAFRRFQVGSMDSLGGNLPALQSALGEFHQRYYVASHLQLWLQGPQSLDELAELAHFFAAGFPGGLPPESPPSAYFSNNVDLQLAVEDKPAVWRCPLIEKGDNVTTFREFLLDEAPGSLLAGLRECGLADDVALNWLYQDERVGWLALVFSSDHPDAIKQHVERWLQALRHTSPEQQMHYYKLAQRRFDALTPLEQLRQRALGFAPDSPPVDFAGFCASLLSASASSLVCRKIAAGDGVATQGFTMPLSRWQPQTIVTDPLAFSFYPQAATAEAPELPLTTSPMLHVIADNQTPTLIVRKPFYSVLSQAQGMAISQQIRPLLAQLRHAGGSGEWQTVDGNWQLTLQLPESGGVAERVVTALMRRLSQPAPGTVVAPETIAIRQLLQQLPEQLAIAPPQEGWLAAMVGGSSNLAQQVARLLSLLNAPVNAELRSSAGCRRGIKRLSHASSDSALLVFIPLPEGASLAALHLLALLCEPQFFQRLRVEQQIGYVVSCRYQRIADRDGLLLALQSPDRSAGNLLRCCKTFLRQLTLCGQAEFSQLQHQLAEQNGQVRDASATALAALRQRYHLPVAKPQDVNELQLDEIIALWREITRRRRSWQILYSAPTTSTT